MNMHLSIGLYIFSSSLRNSKVA